MGAAAAAQVLQLICSCWEQEPARREGIRAGMKARQRAERGSR